MKAPAGQVSKVKQYATRSSIRVTEKTMESFGKLKSFMIELAGFFLFVGATFKAMFSKDFEFREFVRQCYVVGNKTLPLISVTGIIMGLVLTIQSRPVLIKFGAVSMLPSMVAISLIREMGPMVTSLICAGKIGSGIGAELGSMKVTEQIDAMEVSSTHPLRFLVVTRVLACIFMIPLLILYADTLGMLGSWAGVNIKGDVNIVLFFSQAFSTVEFIDFIPAFIKSFFFGAVIGFVGCYKGYHAGKGTESVGKAANSAVVIASLILIIVDMVAVQITDMIES